MALSAGTRLGPYEIIAPLGAGGMGEVYRARDMKLNRDVAIKVLLTAVARDPERIARFSREAQILAALNHPNIAHIHGLEESDGTPALVMEFVEGETLAERLHGALAVDEALAIAKQLADALETAHEQGIIHRDLKPANIKIRPDGTVKVLDFGLAKAFDPLSGSGVNATISPTLSVHATQAGIILGTAAYMAPEPARGRAVDKRADIWAFGCVLYEMLTGARAFPGDDVTDTIVAVVSKEPDWAALPPDAARVRPVIARCLKKDPKARMRDIGEARLQIDDILGGAREGVAVTLPPASLPTPRHVAFLTFAALAGGAMIAALATWMLMRPSPPLPTVPTRFAIVPSPSQPLSFQGVDRDIAISPDGTYIAYRSDAQGGGAGGRLFIRRIDQLDARQLPGISNARAPFFSPDSQWIAFFEGPELKKATVDGSPAITVCRTTGPTRGARWAEDNTIVFATGDSSTGLLRVPAGGGEPKVLTRPDAAQQEADHYFPSALPGGRGVLFTISQEGNSQVAVLDSTTGQRKTLIRGGSNAEYIDPAADDKQSSSARSRKDGYLLYAAAGTLRAVRFDLAHLEVISDPVPVLERVMVSNNGAANFAVSRHGTLIYVPGGVVGQYSAPKSLVWVDRKGHEEPIYAPPRAYAAARLSPDGTQVALDIRDQENDLWIWNLARQNLTRLTSGPGVDQEPVWTPDGRHIIFASFRSGTSNLYRRAADGTGTDERLTTSSNAQFATSITSDGTRVAGFEAFSSSPDIVLFTQESSSTLPHAAAEATSSPWTSRPLLRTPMVLDVYPEISPDGRYVAYQSNESGQFEIYVRPFPKMEDGRWQVSIGGGTRSVWARNGRELFYLDASNTLIVLSTQTGGAAFVAGNPAKVFETRYSVPVAYRSFNISPDGKRFLMIKDFTTGDDKATPASLVVVEHWFEELKTRMLTK